MATERDDRSLKVDARYSTALSILLFGSILLLWAPSRWAASLYQVGVFALAVAWIVRGRRLRWNFVLLPIGAAVLWGLAQLALGQTVYRWETWNAVLTWTTQFVCTLLGLQILAARQVRLPFLRSLLYFGFALSVVSTLQLFTAEGNVYWLFPSGYKDLVLGPFVYHNQYAAFVEMVFPLAIVASLRDRARALIYAGMAGVLYASVIASASRAGTALVTLELAAILAIALARGSISKRTAGVVTGSFLAFVLCFGTVVGWQTLWDRMRLPDPYTVRGELLRASIDMVRNQPGMGYGLGTWSTAYPSFAYSDDGLFTNQAHNDWAQWAAEGGIPFFLLMLLLAIRSVRLAVRAPWGIGVVAIFLHCTVDYPIQRPALGGLFFVLLGALAAEVNEPD